MSLSEQEVLSLAPDDGSAKSGRELAKPDKWLTLAFDEKALWGEIKGSGSTPYRTQVDKINIAFKCSCPSRKFPCKHGLGLLLIYANVPERFSQANAPEWVNEWLNKRSEKAEKPATESAKNEPKDAKAAEKRKESREKKVSGGIEEILLWEKDIIRNGMLGIPEKSHSFWRETAARMVDAQAGGLSAMLRQIGDINYFGTHWKDELLEGLAKIYIACKGYQNIEQLPANVQEDVRAAIGFNKNQEELKQMPGIDDHWLVLGRQMEEDEGLIIQSNWLYGVKSKHHALILNFSHRSQPLIQTLIPGSAIDANLVYYPSNWPQRALIKEQRAIIPFSKPPAYQDLSLVEKEYAEAIALNPWIQKMSFIVHHLCPVLQNGHWALKDEAGKYLLIAKDFSKIYELLAISGGHALDMAFVLYRNEIQPLGIWQHDKYILL